MVRLIKPCHRLLLVLAFCWFPATVIACNCTLPSACVAYSNAEVVFVGRIVDVRDHPSESVLENKVVRFAVEQRFKGTVAAEEVVTFMRDYCAERTLLPGEKYLVYMDKSNFVGFCNKTYLVAEKSPDLVYLNGISSDNPIFTIRGFLPGLSAQELNAFRVVIKHGRNQITRRLDREGRFEAVVRKWGAYKVNLDFPFEVGLVEMTSGMIGYDVQTRFSKNRTVASYDVEAVPNHCDDGTVQFTRVNDIR